MPSKKKVEESRKINDHSRYLNSLLRSSDEYQEIEVEKRKFLCTRTVYPILSLFSGRRIDSIDGPCIIAEIIDRKLIPMTSGDVIKKVCSITWSHFNTGLGGVCDHRIYDHVSQLGYDVGLIQREHGIDIDILFPKHEDTIGTGSYTSI